MYLLLITNQKYCILTFIYHNTSRITVTLEILHNLTKTMKIQDRDKHILKTQVHTYKITHNIKLGYFKNSLKLDMTYDQK